jgi:drug/metabolite transporter (DMT)-like permease
MNRRGILALAVAVVLWGTSYALVKTIGEIPPITIAFLRTLISLPLLIPLALRTNEGIGALATKWKPFLALGITGVVGYHVLQNIGLSMTSSSEASVLLNSDPIFIAMLSSYFLKEKISIYKAIGIAIAFIGATTIVLQDGFTRSAVGEAMMGNIFALLAALSWALFSVLGKKVLETSNAYSVTAFSSLFGAIALAPLAIGFEGLAFPSDTLAWLILAVLGLGASGTSYLLWHIAITESKASDACLAFFFIPIIAILVGIVLLGEAVTALFLTGSCLVLIGVLLTQRR